MTHQLHPQTLAIRGSKEQTAYNEHQQALFTSSLYCTVQQMVQLFLQNKNKICTYSRTANPTVTTFQKRIAQLEQAEEGIATGTGMAAIQAALLTFLSAGDHLISSRSLFGTTAGFITGHLMRFGIEVTFVSQTDVSEWEKPFVPIPKCCFWKRRPIHWAKWAIWKS